MRRRFTHTSYFIALFLILTLVISFIHVPIASSQDSETIKEKLKELQEEVAKLPLDEAFEKENIHAARGRRKALVNKIKAVIHKIEAGAYKGAIKKLEKDLKNKILAWITDEYEVDLIERINEIIDLLKGVPVAAFSFKPETPTVGEVVTFNASASYDPNGYIVSYVWDFGDGTNGTGMIVDHIYLTEGTFKVTLTVTDNDCLSDTAKAKVKVTAVSAPLHDIAVVNVVSYPSVVKVGGTVAVNVTVRNEGTITETFNVSVYHNLTLLETRTNITLDAGAETTLTFTWVTTSEGIYLIRAEVPPLPEEIDIDDNIFVDGTVTVTLLQPPVASFTFSPKAPYTGQDVTFDASLSYDSDGTIVGYTWSFGDGTTGYGKNVTHSYADNGAYAVELTVVDNDGLTNIKSKSITVLNRPPAASFRESATSVFTGTVIYFNASDSHDPDGDIAEYLWNFGDGTNATGVFVNHSYADDGIYIVTLTVTDDDGATATATATKTILNRLPIASFTESTETVYTGEVIYFNASGSYDPDGYIVSYFWDFGDGTNGTGVTTDHAYADDGLYIVTLTVTDDDDAIITSTAAKAVSNRPPTASFTENATTAYRGKAIRFNASASFDPDGYITSYFWNFGDGTNATGAVVDHTYVNVGTYTVTLIITDDDDAIAIAMATKTIVNHPPIASFTENATTVQTGVVIRFEASASYDPDGTIESYTWDFSDGSKATGMTVTHSYADDGTYMVTLTVTDNDGATASSTATKTILNRPPVASFTESAIKVFAGEVIQFNASASYDPDGSIVSYTWNFGDDNITTTSTPIINHTYKTPGTYNVTLTVTDDDGLTDNEVKSFTVEVAPWPLWLIVAIILLVLAATAAAIYLWRRRRKKQGVSSNRVKNYKLTLLMCF